MASLFFGAEQPPQLPGGLTLLIQDATADVLSTPDWGANLTISDKVKALSSADMADVVKVLRLQLTKGTKRTKLLALFLVESLSKNCGMKFLQAMGTAEFMAAFKKIAKDFKGKRDEGSKMVSEKALELVQTWGEEFLAIKDRYGLGAFVATYHELRAASYVFPLKQLDETRPPVFTPPAVHAEATAASAPAYTPTGPPAPEFPQQRPESSLPGDARVLRAQANMVAEMLHAISSRSDAQSNDVLPEMLEQLKSHLPKLQEAVGVALSRSPELAEGLLNLNDDILVADKLWQHMKLHGPPKNPVAVSLPGPTGADPVDGVLSDDEYTPAPAPAPAPAAVGGAHAPSHPSGRRLAVRSEPEQSDPFAARGSGSALVGASASTTTDNLASGISRQDSGKSAMPAQGMRHGASGSQGHTSVAAAASIGSLTKEGTIRIAGAKGTRRRRNRGTSGGLRAPSGEGRLRTSSSASATSAGIGDATGVDDLLGGLDAPAPAPAPAQAGDSSDPFAALSGAAPTQAPAPAPTPSPAPAPSRHGLDLDSLFAMGPGPGGPPLPPVPAVGGHAPPPAATDPFASLGASPARPQQSPAPAPAPAPASNNPFDMF